jgi:transposase
MAPDDHRCPWRDEAERLAALVVELQAALNSLGQEVAQLRRQVVGPKTEKIPPPESELDDGRQPRDSDAAQRKRRERAEQRAATIETEHHKCSVPDEQRRCPRCGGEAKPVGEPKRSVQYEYIPGRFVAHIYEHETVACTCGQHIVRAEGPRRLFDQSRYGPGFVAYLAVSKCCDSTPIYRLEKQFLRMAIPISRGTMNALFLRAGEELMPLYERMLEITRASWLVQADETSIKVQSLRKRGFVWTFLGEKLAAYVFSPDRSGQTPSRILGGTEGTLVVDGYTGYNQVTDVDGRERSGCMSHARRKFFEARETAPEANEAIDLIRELFRVEHDATEQRVVGTAGHLEMRRTRAGPILASLREWLETQKPQHVPQSPMATAVGYCLNQWEHLTRFLDDPRIPIHNNASERALRVVALGRKNFLFFGNEDAARKICVLYSLIASCEGNGVNPTTYLTDVLLRIQTHPRAQLDDLLPHRWKPAKS